jgi:hypothetical protein
MSDTFTIDQFRWLRQVAADSDLPATASRVAIALTKYFNRKKGGLAFMAQTTLAQELGLSVRPVRYALDELVKRGHLIARRRGMQQTNLYRLGLVRELSLQVEGFWANSIVPLAVEVVAGEVQVTHFCVGHLDAGGIGVLIEFATNLQTCLRRRRGDQLDDDLMADERLAAPVSGNEREEAMLDLVPLAGAGWQVTHGDGNAELVGQLL